MASMASEHHPQEHSHHHHHEQNHHQKQPSASQLSEEMKTNKNTLVDHQIFLRLTSDTPFLLKNWSLQTTEGLVSALVLTTVIAMVHEAVIHSLHTRETFPKGSCDVTDISIRLRLTALHTLHIFLAYILMLSVMTFNLWLLVVVALGAGLGHFLFRPLFQRIHSSKNSTGNIDPCNKNMILQNHKKDGNSSSKSGPLTDNYTVNNLENTELLQISPSQGHNELQKEEIGEEDERQHLQPLLTKLDECSVNIVKDAPSAHKNKPTSTSRR